MNRNGLIVLQVVGGLSILPYPFVLLANVMSMAATGNTPATRLFWGLLCLYPLVWIVLYVMSWQAMKRGAVSLAFGLSSIPALSVLLVVGVFAFSWVSYGLGTAGIGPGGLHSTVITHPTNDNPVLAAILLAGQDVQVIPESEAVDKALKMIDAHPELVNVSVPGKGSPLNVALGALSITVDGTILGAPERRENRLRMVRALVSHAAHLNNEESSDLRKTWNLKRALYDGPVTTSKENPLVWRIVTHQSGPSEPFDPFNGRLPPRDIGPTVFTLTPSETSLLNRSTSLHGTPLYAALLDNARETYPVLIKAGARLSPEEERDPAAHGTLRAIFQTHPDLQSAYNVTP